jgi:hypothetical protein
MGDHSAPGSVAWPTVRNWFGRCGARYIFSPQEAQRHGGILESLSASVPFVVKKQSFVQTPALTVY